MRRRERCPDCGALSERRQLICLGCGERLALEPKRPGPPVIAAASALGAVGLISLAFVAQAVLGGRDGPPRPVTALERAAPEPAAGPDRRRAEVRLRSAAGRARRQLAAASAGWPRDRTGWTAVLLATSDRQSAERLAAQLGGSGVEAGVISPQERPDLGTLWLVFSGVHPDQATARTATVALQARYPQAYTRFVPSAPATAPAAQPPPG